LLGVFVGQIVNTEVSKQLLDEVKYYSMDSDSLNIMLLLDPSPVFCSFYLEESEKLEGRTWKIGNELEYLEKVKGVYDYELKKEYFILETKSYLLSEKINLVCKTDKVNILYFYSQDCEDCEKQGNVLDSLSPEFPEGKIAIYSFDGELGSTIVEGLKKKYSIYNYPSIVIDEKVFRGYKEKDELLNISE
ncbi:MAG: hypothetical protein PHU63_03990, partial [Candidatus ainarchaeum sp.]|nr:hypothetical protein [Candidatus ainarchaeum sp.]